MGPPPRSLAAEANDCFMVRLPHGATEYKVAARSSRAIAGSPRIIGEQPNYRRPTDASKDVTTSTPPRDGNTIPLHNGEQEKQSMPRGRQPKASTPSATPNDKLDIAPVVRSSNRSPRSVIVAPRTNGPERSVGTTPWPGWSRCKPSMPLGMMRCPTAYATVPPPNPFRPLLISTSIHSSQSCHRVATGAIDPQRNQRCTR